MNSDLIKKYFTVFNDIEEAKLVKFDDYLTNFYNFCFELHLDNMIEKAIEFK